MQGQRLESTALESKHQRLGFEVESSHCVESKRPVFAFGTPSHTRQLPQSLPTADDRLGLTQNQLLTVDFREWICKEDQFVR